jgi:hypothetical protein
MAEADLYLPVQMTLLEQLGTVTDNPYLETCATKGFTETFKAAIPEHREISFAFMSKRPDIVGYTDTGFKKDLITVEVKESLTIDNIYQAKMYKEVFAARYNFLITRDTIPDAIKRLCRQTPAILHSLGDDSYSFLVIARFHLGGGFIDWFPDNPFPKDFYWK